MRNTYQDMINEEKASDGVRELERVPVLFDEMELNYLRQCAVVMNLPFTTVVRIVVREHMHIVEVIS